MRHNLVEAVLAAVVLAAAGMFLAFAVAHSRLRPMETYPVSAHFSDAGGLQAGDGVSINGVRVGTVTRLDIDPVTLAAVVGMGIREGIRLPADTVAAVVATGPLGGKAVQLIPGHSRATLSPGGTLAHTRAYKSLEETVSKEIFGAGLDSEP